MPPISVVITERRKARRNTCRTLLAPEKGIRVVGEARGALEVITAVEKLKPRILLLDATLLAGDAASLLPLIRRRSPHTRVLLLTDHLPGERTIDTLSRGARGYLDKAALRTDLPRAVRVVAAGQAWIPRRMVARLMKRLSRLTATA